MFPSHHETIRVKTFQSDALFALLQLNLIAIAGPIVTEKQMPSNALLSFTLPSHMENNQISDFSMLPKDLKGANKHPITLEIRPVFFANVEDVEMLWIESCKTFGDLCHQSESLMFKKSYLCLKVREYGYLSLMLKF